MEKERLTGLDYEFYNFNGVNYENQKVVYSQYLPFFDECAFMLDLGCGKGDFQVLMAERGKVCLGVDSDPKMCEQARSRGVNAECRDALEFLSEQPEGRFDCIFAAHLVEHLPFQAVIELVDNSLKALRPGGLLLLTTPNVRSLWPHLEDFYLHFGHIRFYHPRCLEFFLQNAGFAEIESGENERLKGHLFGEQLKILSGLKDSLHSVEETGRVEPEEPRIEETALEELVMKRHVPQGLAGLPLLKTCTARPGGFAAVKEA